MMRTREQSFAHGQSKITPWMLPETTHKWAAKPSNLVKLVAGFEPITLQEMDDVALLNRIDTKFMMPASQLLSVLARLSKNYRVLSVCGQRLHHYRTLYFDMPGFDLYRLHVIGSAEYYKVRSREYIESGLSFLEVKHKTHKGRTVKNRISTALPVSQITVDAEKWLQGVFPYRSRGLEPKILNTFTRVTLVSKRLDERVTLDVDLAFFAGNKSIRLNNIGIAEVKMDSNNKTSPFIAQMRAEKLHPQGLSKYCLGVSLLYDCVKKNQMKPKILKIEKMTGGSPFYE